MSLIDIILQQDTILYTLIFAAVPMVAAVLLILLRRVRALIARFRAWRAARREARKEQQARANAEAIANQAAAFAVTGEEDMEMNTGDGEITAEVEAGESDEATADEPQSEGDKPAVNSAVQDILESVFTDDELTAHYEALLRDTETVDIQDLLEQCQQVAAQLREKFPAAS